MENIKKLDGYISFTEAAKLIGVSRQRFAILANKDSNFLPEDFRQIGNGSMFIVKTEAVEKFKLRREREKTDK